MPILFCELFFIYNLKCNFLKVYYCYFNFEHCFTIMCLYFLFFFSCKFIFKKFEIYILDNTFKLKVKKIMY